MPEHFTINDNMIVKGRESGWRLRSFVLEHRRSLGKALAEASHTGKVVLKTDNITTDHILPAGAKLLPYRFERAVLTPTTALSTSIRSSRPAARSRAAA